MQDTYPGRYHGSQACQAGAGYCILSIDITLSTLCRTCGSYGEDKFWHIVKKKFNIRPSFAIWACSAERRPGMSRHVLGVSKLNNFASRHGGINSTERAESC